MNNIRRYIFLSFLMVPGITTAQSLLHQEYSQKEKQQISIEDFKYQANYKGSKNFFSPVRKKPGFALISSAVIPGSGQAANGKWLRAGAYILAEAVLLTVHLTSLHDAREQERQYEQFANQNWSVVTYARWLDNYYENNGIASQPIDELRSQIEGIDPTYNTDVDWNVVDIELLRRVERNTPFIYPDRTGNNFSHVMPDYGSQQYYELISKYYQYGPGWRDFGSRYKLNWDGTDMPPNFFKGSKMAETFNDNYRLAGNMVSLLILNHIISAFDAFLTVKTKNNRLKAKTNPLNPGMFSLKYHF